MPRNPAFRLLWAAGAISDLGSSLLIVAVPVQVFRLTGSTLATGLTVAIEALPAIAVGPWAGALVDRWPRRTTMLIADLASAAGVALILAGTTPARTPAIYLGLLADNLAVAFHRPAARAILPGIAGPDLAAANSATAFTAGATRLAGPALGTLLLTAGGLGLTVSADIASYLAAAMLTAALPTEPARAPTGTRKVWTEIRQGWTFLTGTPVLRGLLVTTWAYWTGNAALTALLVPFVTRRLAAPGPAVGYLISGLGTGYLLGAALARPLIARWPTRGLITAAYTAVGLCFLALFNAPDLATAIGATALAGVPGAVAVVATQVRLQAATPGAILGRVGAVFFASDAVAAVTGALLAPAITAAAGLGPALDILSAAVGATAVAAYALLPPA